MFTIEDLENLYKARAETLKLMTDLNAKDSLDEAEAATFEQLQAKYDKADRDIEIGKATLKLSNETDSVLGANAAGISDEAMAYAKDFMTYFKGEMSLQDAKAAMSVGVAADGGYTVPETFQNTVLMKLYTFSKTRNISSSIRTTSLTKIPVEGDTPTFGWVEELAAYPKSNPTFGQTSISAYKMGGIIQISEELLSDSAINIEAYIALKIAKAMDKLESTAFTTGNGVNKPTGYLTGLAAGANSTTAAVAAVTSDELYKIFWDLKEEYRANSTWRMNDLTLKAISALKDGQGNYIFPTLRDGSVPTLFGRPIVTDPNMAVMGAGNTFICVGDFSYYQVADRGVMSIQRLNELYAENGMVGYKVTARVDAKRLLDEAFNIAKNAAA